MFELLFSKGCFLRTIICYEDIFYFFAGNSMLLIVFLVFGFYDPGYLSKNTTTLIPKRSFESLPGICSRIGRLDINYCKAVISKPQSPCGGIYIN